MYVPPRPGVAPHCCRVIGKQASTHSPQVVRHQLPGKAILLWPGTVEKRMGGKPGSAIARGLPVPPPPPPPHLGPFRCHQHSKHSTAHTTTTQPTTIPIITVRGMGTREMLAWGSAEGKETLTTATPQLVSQAMPAAHGLGPSRSVVLHLRVRPLWGSHIRYPAYQLLTLQFITVVRLQL